MSVPRHRKSAPVSHRQHLLRGPRMDDIFFGDGPPIVSSIIELPRIVRLTVAMADDGVQELRVTHRSPSVPLIAESQQSVTDVTESVSVVLPAVTTIPEPLPALLREARQAGLSAHQPAMSPDDVWKEFSELLKEEEERSSRFVFRAEAFRREIRAEINAHVRTSEPASSSGVHHRARTSRRSLNRSSLVQPPDPPVVPHDHRSDSRASHERSRTRAAEIQWIRSDVSHRASSPSISHDTKDVLPAAHDEERRSSTHIPSSRSRTVSVNTMSASSIPWAEDGTLALPPVPWSAVRRQATIEAPTEPVFPQKFRVREGMGVVAGALIAGVLVGILGSIGAIPRLSHVLAEQVSDGAGHLSAGLRAAAVADVSASQSELDAAAARFAEAERTLEESTSLTFRLLGSLDPKERYTSGRSLLEAGQKLSALGKDLADVMAVFHEHLPAVDTLVSQTTGGNPPTREAGTTPSSPSTPPVPSVGLTETLEQVLPRIAVMASELGEIDALVRDVQPDVLPEAFRADLAHLQSGVHTLAGLTQSIAQSHTVLLELLGAHRDRQYLMVFQNNRELRPTGGFIGSFALVDVSRGRVSNVRVDTIYNPDGQLHDFLVPPRPLQKITDRWFTRDANWFADYRRSARSVAKLFEKSGGPTVDGVIAVTPTVLERLLRVTGPIEMPAYTTTVTADNVIDETQRLVTFEYDRTKNVPKAFLADLLPEILKRVAELPRERWGDLVGALTDTLREKHLLVYLTNEEAQASVEKLGWGGAVDATSGDYLLRVEANVGGHKTDELMEQSVEYDVTVEADGSAVATLVTTRHHKGSRDGRPDWKPEEDWYRLPNVIYERTLVPNGSTLLEARGFTADADVPTPYVNTADYRTFTRDPELAALEDETSTHESGTVIGEEEGKTSFGNWAVTKPGETVVTVYRYRLPLMLNTRSVFEPSFRYGLLAQSQPGHQPVRFHATLHAPPGYRVVWAGPEGSATGSERMGEFSTILASDRAWGVVVERQ